MVVALSTLALADEVLLELLFIAEVDTRRRSPECLYLNQSRRRRAHP